MQGSGIRLPQKPVQRRAPIIAKADAAVNAASISAEENPSKGFLGIAPLTWQKIIPLGFMFFCILFNYTILRDTKVPHSGLSILLNFVSPCANVYRSMITKLIRHVGRSSDIPNLVESLACRQPCLAVMPLPLRMAARWKDLGFPKEKLNYGLPNNPSGVFAFPTN